MTFTERGPSGPSSDYGAKPISKIMAGLGGDSELCAQYEAARRALAERVRLDTFREPVVLEVARGTEPDAEFRYVQTDAGPVFLNVGPSLYDALGLRTTTGRGGDFMDDAEISALPDDVRRGARAVKGMRYVPTREEIPAGEEQNHLVAEHLSGYERQVDPKTNRLEDVLVWERVRFRRAGAIPRSS